MSHVVEATPLYRPLACWFCIPSFIFLLAPILAVSGEAGIGWAILAVLTSVWVAPMFTLLAVATAMIGHYSAGTRISERKMWLVIVLAIAANVLLSAGGFASRILR